MPPCRSSRSATPTSTPSCPTTATGPSHFPRVQHPEVEYEAGDVLTWDRYHTVDVMYAWMERWAERYPDLVEVYQVGTSYEGRPILQATLTNTATGPATDKPAAYFEGGRHSGEITSSESVLWLMQHLVEGTEATPRSRGSWTGRPSTCAPRTTPTARTSTCTRPRPTGARCARWTRTATASSTRTRPMDLDGDGVSARCGGAIPRATGSSIPMTLRAASCSAWSRERGVVHDPRRDRPRRRRPLRRRRHRGPRPAPELPHELAPHAGPRAHRAEAGPRGAPAPIPSPSPRP
jgi:hypothetical protein